MKRKTIAIFVIAGLIAMVVLVGTAAADGNANIFASRTAPTLLPSIDIILSRLILFWGYLGDESEWYGEEGGRVYVVAHQDTWTNGTPLVDVSGGNETLPWVASGHFFILAWPTPLTAGEYDLILDLNCTGHNGVWTTIPDPRSGKTGIITDPIWDFTVTGPSGPEINVNTTAFPTVTEPDFLSFFTSAYF